MPNEDLSLQIYQARQEAARLRRQAFERPLAETPQETLEKLAEAEAQLARLEMLQSTGMQADPLSGMLVQIGATRRPTLTLGAQTTGLSAQIFLRMAQVPTAICHLFDPETHPLVSCTVKNHSQQIRRLRVTCFVEGYSARAIETVEINPGQDYTFNQLPTFFPVAVRELDEVARATLNVLVEDLDTLKVESHTTHPIWLLARTAAPLAVKDPQTGVWQDLTRYLGAFVTPNAQPVMAFLRQVVEFHPQQRLTGYQEGPSQVEPQIQAVYAALAERSKIRYVHSPIAFSPDSGLSAQRVRLPGESLANQQANCLDGTVLFASLLEAISLEPALVLVPGHAFLGWNANPSEPAEWKYLETTLVGTHPYNEARTKAEVMAIQYSRQAEKIASPDLFRRWSLRELRTTAGILPLE